MASGSWFRKAGGSGPRGRVEGSGGLVDEVRREGRKKSSSADGVKSTAGMLEWKGRLELVGLVAPEEAAARLKTAQLFRAREE
jgi:hypothetical protein